MIKTSFFRLLTLSTLLTGLAFTSCSKNSKRSSGPSEEEIRLVEAKKSAEAAELRAHQLREQQATGIALDDPPAQ